MLIKRNKMATVFDTLIKRNNMATVSHINTQRNPHGDSIRYAYKEE